MKRTQYKKDIVLPFLEGTKIEALPTARIELTTLSLLVTRSTTEPSGRMFCFRELSFPLLGQLLGTSTGHTNSNRIFSSLSL